MPKPTLHLLFCVLLIFSCAPPHACISCYTNYAKGSEMNLLGNHGRRGILPMECPDAKECFEALAKPVVGLDAAMYSSGCADCPRWSYPLECKKCSSSKCNRDIIKSIWTTHRECFVANDETIMGKRRAYCTKGIDTCYWIQVRDDHNVIRYTANCGTGWQGCTTCKENLCNAPPDVKKRVQDEVKVMEEEDAKEDAQVLPSEQVAMETGNANSNGGSSNASPSDDRKKRNDEKNDKKHKNSGYSDANKETDKEEEGKSEEKDSDNDGAPQRKKKRKDKNGRKHINDTKGGKKSDVELDDVDTESCASSLSDAAVQIFLLIICTLATLHLH